MRNQLVRVTTRSGTPLYIDICADEDEKIFVLMNITAFTVGTHFESAKKAIEECVKVINQVINYKRDGDRIEALYSDPGAIFISNEAMATLIPPPCQPEKPHPATA